MILNNFQWEILIFKNFQKNLFIIKNAFTTKNFKRSWILIKWEERQWESKIFPIEWKHYICEQSKLLHWWQQWKRLNFQTWNISINAAVNLWEKKRENLSSYWSQNITLSLERYIGKAKG